MKSSIAIWAAPAAIILLFVTIALPLPNARRGNDLKEASEQADKASRIFEEILDAPDRGIPKDLLEGADCIAVFPTVIKAAFILGGKGGKGLVSCRDRQTRAWGPPVFLKIGGGSIGFQIGAEATDLILLGMNTRTAEMFKKNRFELGAEAQAAAGPVGRSASASTDLPTLRTGFLSYSRSRGAFAGVALKGSVINRDDDLNKAVYGGDVTAGEILAGQVKAPTEIVTFQNTLNHYASPKRGRRRSS